jgi:hypothetical protein
VAMCAPLDNVHQASVVPIIKLLAGARASPITTTQAIAATAESCVQRRTITAAMVNVSNAISALEIVFVLIRTVLEIPFAPTFHPIGETAATVATFVLLLSAPQAVAVLNTR